MPRRKKKAKTKIKIKNGKVRKIDIDQILFEQRQLFIFDPIDGKLAQDIVKKMIALNRVNHEPIVLYINSPGGCLSDGFAIIDCMKGIQSPVITYIVGQACSMAGLISIAGDQRLISCNSKWMGHDGHVRLGGKFQDVIDYGKHVEAMQSHIFRFMRDHTKLSESDIEKAKKGQLWLGPGECLQRGVVDAITQKK